MDNTFSLIHFNSRSMYTNFNKIKDYLNKLNREFKLIAFSETWLKEGRGINFHLDGYELHYINRPNKIGGGVAFFVDRSLRCRLVENMLLVKEDLMECITVEIELEKSKNIVVACVYRAPGSSIDVFRDSLEELMKKLSENKTYMICGDVNIDLLSASKHTATSDFLSTMYGRGFYPLITKPRRITSTSATLIDNIFLNVINKNINSGLATTDITDHLPVFVMYNCQIKSKIKENCVGHARLRTEKAIDMFRNDLFKEEWKVVYTEEVNAAYESFLNCYLSHYGKHCPVIQYKYENKDNKKPWISKGLPNACKKKNKLYRDFIKFRTKNAEKQYKLYKNKLTTIMRQAKKDYYNKILNENKNNLKSTWKMMGNKVAPTELSNYFINDDKEAKDMNKVANELNSCFVKVGPNLASCIPQHDGQAVGIGKRGSKVLQSVYLEGASENEIRTIVTKNKNK